MKKILFRSVTTLIVIIGSFAVSVAIYINFSPVNVADVTAACIESSSLVATPACGSIYFEESCDNSCPGTGDLCDINSVLQTVACR